MNFETLQYETTGRLSTITLNRPEKRNAISIHMIAELQAALDEIEKTPTRVVILTGSGKAFCAGIDLDYLQAIGRQTAAENQEDSKRIAKMFRKIWSYSRPMIAAVNGPALAGGFGIATLCDFTLAVPEATFGYTEVRIGFLPAIVSVFLTRQMSRAHELAEIILAASPSSITRAKHLLVSSAAANVDNDLERAVLESARVRCTPDFREGIAAFLEKRKPIWQSDAEKG